MLSTGTTRAQRLAVLLGTGLGVGFIPFAPGTAGTLVPGVVLAWWLGSMGLLPVLAAAAALFLAGLWAAGRCEEALGRKDPPAVVIDEVAAFLLVTAGIPPGWKELLLAFILFRAADILKPWPVRLIDRRVPGGAGIMLDDLAAAAYARLALELLRRLLPAGLLAA